MSVATSIIAECVGVVSTKDLKYLSPFAQVTFELVSCQTFRPVKGSRLSRHSGIYILPTVTLTPFGPQPATPEPFARQQAKLSPVDRAPDARHTPIPH